jgi:hypothetical protein
LDHPIGRRRDSQAAELSITLGNHPFSGRKRAEAAGFDLLSQLVKEALNPDLGFDVSGCYAIYPGRARPLVGPHPIPRNQQEGGIGDEIKQILEPVLRVTGCPSVQFGLDLQYPTFGH